MSTTHARGFGFVWLLTALLWAGASTARAGGALADSGAVFTVMLPGDAAAPLSGRLIVLVKKSDAKLPPGTEPIDGPFWDDPQPLFGIDVKNLAPGGSATLDASADGFPMNAGELPPGSYVAQARLDVSRTSSDWKNHDGNRFSKAVAFTIEAGKASSVLLALTETTRAEPLPEGPRITIVTVPSPILSEFAGRPIELRAAVVSPETVDASRRYAAVYHVPGFGGGLGEAEPLASGTRRGGDAAGGAMLDRNVFHVVLDPESQNGHTLFADSANNGPRGRALVSELIPAIEARFPLEKRPAARLLRGHSSGGWSTLWLAITYPNVFGATWSSAPDPVDFRKFQLVNIYNDENMYRTPGADADTPSYRRNGRVLMTIRQENGGEEIVGPDNTAAQQWDSWLAVFGPRNERGHPAALYDPRTGAIDHTVAMTYRAFDIGEIVRSDPKRLGPIFRRSIRLYVGDQDNFYLNEAVDLLRADLERLFPESEIPESERHGFIRVLPGYDHGTIFGSPELRAIPADMMDHLKRSGLAE